MIFNKEYYTLENLEIYHIILEKLSNIKTISSKSRGVRYELRIITEEINFRRVDAENHDKFEKITKEKFIAIIKYIKTLKKIDTSTLKPIIGGKQAPTLAILDYCGIIEIVS